jgi:1,2-phenylacetyl-CoA epoxidase catalytic subunit
MAADKNNAQISSSIYQTKNNWVDAVLESVIRAGVEQPTDKNIVAETQNGSKTKAGN